MGSFPLGTVSTSAIKLHPVVKDFETVTLGNAVLKVFKSLILKFDDLSTRETDEVIVMIPGQNRFILGRAIGKFPFSSQAQTGEELQGPIDRSVTNLRIQFGHLGIDLAQILVPGGVQEGVEDLLPLFGSFQSLAGNPSFELVGSNGESPF